jgi:hypothetical protein
MKAKARVPDPRGEQPERLAANEAGCGRVSLRCASKRRKIALNSPGIRGMSVEAEFEKRPIMDFEQPVGDVDSEIRVDPDQVSIEGRMMELRQRQAI